MYNKGVKNNNLLPQIDGEDDISQQNREEIEGF